MPNQSSVSQASVEITDEIVKSNINLKNILIALSHYSPSNRKDALNRLKDLIVNEQRILVLHLGQIISSIAPMILDREYEVRKALIQFAKTLVKATPSSLILPFIPLIVTYSCSAMNHIINELRFDAVRFANVWIEDFPNSFVGNAHQIIQNYMSLLNLKKQRVSGQDLFNKKLKDSAMDGDQIVVLNSMNYLLKLLSKENKFETSSKSPQSSLYFEKDISLTNFKDRWFQSSLWSVDVFSSNTAHSISKFDTVTDRISLNFGDTVVSKTPTSLISWSPVDFIIAIIPACVDVWLESSPVVLGGAMIIENSALEKLNLAMGILHQALLNNIHETDRKVMVSTLVKHIFDLFPYGHNAVGIKNEHCELILQEMNIKTCEIISLFQIEDWPTIYNQNWESVVFDYVVKVIAAKDDMLPLQSMKMIFPLCEKTMRNSSNGKELIKVIVKRHKEIPVKTAIWTEMFHFIEKAFTKMNTSINDEVKFDWISYLPKALWSLNSSNPRKLAQTIQTGLIPFFHIITPAKAPLIDITVTSYALEIAFNRQDALETQLESELFFAFVFTVGIIGSTSATIASLANSSGEYNLDGYDALLLAYAACTMNPELKEKHSAKISNADILKTIQKRVYMAKMVGHMMRNLNIPDPTEFVLEALNDLAANIKTIDGFFGLCALLSVISDMERADHLSFMEHLPRICQAGLLFCVAESDENYEILKV
ncbi:Testis-expressed sequence 10 protein [Physocladia obscura]|uniref:Pre-rRNA-processing protein n=1 Tax=Physocladia obscura TaxID=109957 RepID=A0AAD5SWR7_9FUNG|nr:Testis-expressed sequence 10 protein [Physocladia obscura]